jgi:hypothetical protein
MYASVTRSIRRCGLRPPKPYSKANQSQPPPSKRRPKPWWTLTAADDLHADEVYRRDVAATLTQRMLRVAFGRAGQAMAE